MSERVYSAEFASGVRAELTLSLSNIRCEWKPDFPRHFSGQRRRKFIAAYRAWRDECVADFSKQTGACVMVIDL